jgi:phosphonate transport system substrate-binding protein
MRLAAFPLLGSLAACSGDTELPFVSLEPPLESAVPAPAEPDRLRVGIAPVLSAVSSFEHYNPVVEWLAEQLDRPTAYVQRGTYHEINELTRHGAVDLAFVCAGPWLLNGDGLELLVVPEIAGSPHYSAVCLTQWDRAAKGFEDLAGASFGFTDTLSLTGRAYAQARLAQLDTSPERHFGRTVQVEGHDVLIHLLVRAELDGGCVNSVVFDHLSREEPELMKKLRVFERSQPFGAPPVLVPSKQDPERTTQLAAALQALDEVPEGRAMLEALNVDRFVDPPEGLYDEAREFLSILDSSVSP